MSQKVIMNFKIEPEAKEEFERICEEDFKTVSQDLYTYVHRKIKQSKGSKVLLTNLHKDR